MDINDVAHKAGQTVDKINTLKVSIPLTGFFYWLGQWTMQDWITALSLAFLIFQIFCLTPKIFRTVVFWYRQWRLFFKIVARLYRRLKKKVGR